MDITYLGHSAFRLKGKDATLVTDPYDKKSVGFSMPQASADVVTVSHEHDDHNATKQVSGTARRKEPYVVAAPGEYEINGIGVFGWGSFHDDQQGIERGKNTIYSIIVDGVRIVHLGDLGEVISDGLVEDLGTVDLLLVPVGGKFSLDAKDAAAVVEKLSPSIVIPMHYKTEEHGPFFAEMTGPDEFLKLMGVQEVKQLDKLKVTEDNLPETTQVIMLQKA